MKNHPSRWAVFVLAGLIALLAGFVLTVARAPGQTTPASGLRFQQGGVDQGRGTILDCSTGLVCSLSGSVWTMTSTGGGGGAPTSSTYITQVPDAGLTNEQALSALASGYMFSTTTTGVVTTQTATQVTAALNVFTDLLQGLVPASGGGTANFLRADGTWAAPAGGGNVTAGGTLTANALILGAGTTAVAALGSLGTTTTVLHGNAAGAPTFGAVVTADIGNNQVTLAKLATQADLTILGNISGGAAVPTASTLTAILDAILGTTQGAVLYRNATVWTTLAPGTAGQFLQTGGAAANISWQTLAGGGNVSNTGTPTSGQLALWTNATTIQGVTALPAANFPALTGPVTTTAGALGTTIATNAITTTMITDANVTLAKLVNVSAASRLLGRGDSGAGVPQEIVLGTNLSMSGTTLNAAGGGSSDTIVVVAADVTHATSSTTLSDITGLTLTIGASATEQWEFLCTVLSASTSGGPDFKFGFTVPASATMVWSALADQGLSTSSTSIQTATQATTLSYGGFNGTALISLRGVIFGGGTGGAVQAQFAQNASSATAIIAKKGSWCRFAKVVS